MRQSSSRGLGCREPSFTQQTGPILHYGARCVGWVNLVYTITGTMTLAALHRLASRDKWALRPIRVLGPIIIRGLDALVAIGASRASTI